jgi:hypothetical protein
MANFDIRQNDISSKNQELEKTIKIRNWPITDMIMRIILELKWINEDNYDILIQY